MNGSGGHDAPGTPVLPGYAVTWDYDTREWIARKGDIILRGKDQAELDAARLDFILSLADELSQILREAAGRGYSPPPPRTRNRSARPSGETGRAEP